jgi:hypothetical protein
LGRLQPSLWQVVVAASTVAGVGSGWRVLMTKAAPASPLTVAVAMMLVTYAGWYAWAFFTHLTDAALFGGHGDYRSTLNAFGRAYAFQALFALTFTLPLGWLWGWVALYATVAAWGIVGPRRLGMRTWQAIVSATLGMLIWLACLLVMTLTLVSGGLFLGVGVFLT